MLGQCWREMVVASKGAEEQSETFAPRKIADRLILTSFALVVLAIACGLVMFSIVNEIENIAPLLFAVIGLAALAVSCGIVGLRLRSRHRALGGAAIGIGLAIVVLFVVFVIANLIANAS